MAEDQQQHEQKHNKPMSFMTLVILTGLIGGIFWSALAYLAYVLNLTEIHPNLILEPWTAGDWKKGWIGTVISILIIGGISIGAALIYYVALRRFQSIWIGLGYGIVLFVLIFLVLNPLIPGISPFNELGRNTIITTVCFYILYGIFVGYTISFEESEIRHKEKTEQEAES